MKHNKKYNIGVVFELLTKQVAEGVVDNDPKISATATKLINEYFSPGSPLYEELSLFNILLYNQADSHRIASKLLDGILVAARDIDDKELIEKKQALLKEVFNIFKEDTFFKVKIPNYKVYASIQQLLDFAREDKSIKNITEKIILEETVIDHLLNNTELNRVKEEYNKNNKQPVDNLTMKIILEKFNTKYDAQFNSEQKTLLRDFVNNDPTNFKLHAKEEINKVDNVLDKAVTECEDTLLRIKLQDAKKLLNEIKYSGPTENILARLLTYLDLAKDLQVDAS